MRQKDLPEPAPAAAQSALEDLLDVMARLRDPVNGCPWDREQHFETIAPYTIEEAYEVADAIRQGDMDQLEDELGDLLFQIAFYAQMSRERGGFDFADIARRIANKMRDRHPHVFGDAEPGSWETRKAAERAARTRGGRPGILDGVALALPALMRAQKLQKRAALAGFDWRDLAPVVAKIREELGELETEIASGAPSERLRDEAGDLLFACVNLARHLEIDAEVALRDANAKFERRLRSVESSLAEDGKTLAGTDPEELDSLWRRAKEEAIIPGSE